MSRESSGTRSVHGQSVRCRWRRSCDAWRLVALLAGMAVSATACTHVSEPGPSYDEAVYGHDDRLDYYEEPDAALRERARSSIAAMIPMDLVDLSNPSRVELYAMSLGESYELCAGERFADQPTAAACSGTLIDDDLVLTAGHCVDAGCDGYFWVFDYLYEAPGRMAPLSAADVFRCQSVVTQRLDGELDYAIVRLERAVDPSRRPASVQTMASAMPDGAPVTIMGFGSGLPLKIDDGGQVVEPMAQSLNWFSATTDAFGGNSGSGVFDAAGQVVGILVAGAGDYEWAGGCTVPAEYPAMPVSAETITYAHNAVRDLCASGYPSARLCEGAQAVCGDGVCNGDECILSCPDDCSVSCPAAWQCDPAYYAANDGCDCGCGISDPDCADTAQELYGCEAGEVCSNDAVCSAPAPDPGDGGTPPPAEDDGEALPPWDGPEISLPACSARHESAASPIVAWHVLAVFAWLVVSTRRRRSSD